MKKFSLLLLVFFSSFKVLAASSWDVLAPDSLVKNDLISENITCKGKKCVGEFTIPKNLDDQEINIVPSILNTETNNAMPGDTYEYVIKINNQSSHDYAYVAHSFYVKPLISSESVTNTSSFIGKPVNKGGVMYRINSSGALKKLYNTNKNLTDEELSDESLNKVLISKGYPNGVGDLDKYILDYIGSDKNSSLEDNSDNVIKSLWPNISEMPNVLETNPKLINFGYNYFYNKLFSMHLNKTNMDDGTHTIGEWLRNDSIYSEMEGNLSDLYLSNKAENTFKSMYFHINGPLTKNPYILFEFGLDFGFKLKRLDVVDNTPKDQDNHSDIDTTIVVSNEDDNSKTIVDTGVETNIINLFIITLIFMAFLGIIKGFIDEKSN